MAMRWSMRSLLRGMLALAMVVPLLGVGSGIAGSSEPAPQTSHDAVGAALFWSGQFAAGTVDHVLIGRDDVFADNLVSGALQADAVLLLTPADHLDPRVRAEILRLGATRATVLGGEAAISAAVVGELEQFVDDVDRIAGANRWETSVAAAERLGSTTVFVARGVDAGGGNGTAAWADAIAAGAWAASSGASLVLTPTATLHPSVRAYLEEHPVDEVVIIGGAAAVSDAVEAEIRSLVPNTTRVSGPDRLATSQAIAARRHGGAGIPVGGVIGVPGWVHDGWTGAFSASAVAARDGFAVVPLSLQTLSEELAAWLGARAVRQVVCGPGTDPDVCQWLDLVTTLLPPGAMVALDVPRPDRSGVYREAYRSDAYAATPDPVHVARRDDGSIGVLAHDPDADRLLLTWHEPGTMARVGARVEISTAGWPRWGGVHTAEDGTHFVLLGRDNPTESPTHDTIEVRHYDQSWQLIRSGRFSNDSTGVFVPFAGTAPAMAVVDGRLVVHLARTAFTEPSDGFQHQINLTLVADVDTLDLHAYDDRPYSSHSFNQLVVPAGDDVLFVDHGDTYPRSISYARVPIGDVVANVAASPRDVLAFDGPAGADFYQFTGTAVTGLAATAAGGLIVGNSVRHTGDPGHAVDPDEPRNAFVIATDDSAGTEVLRWLTSHVDGSGRSVGDPRMVALGADRFAVLFTTFHGDGGRTLDYRLLDGDGMVLAERSFPGAFLGAVSELVVHDGRISWAGLGDDGLFVFSLDVTDPTTPLLG